MTWQINTETGELIDSNGAVVATLDGLRLPSPTAPTD